MNLKNNFVLFLISVVSLGVLVSCGCRKKLIVINVLDKELYDDCHIKGSVNVPFEQLEDFAKTLDKRTPVVLYCSNYRCTASLIGARMLKSLGVNTVYVYEGGTAEWYQRQLPVNGPCTQMYLKMENEPAHDRHDTEIPVLDWQQLQQMMRS